MEATTTLPTTDQYEVFAPGDCDKPLPLNRIQDVFRFSQFVSLTRRVAGDDVRLVVPRTPFYSFQSRAFAGRTPGATLIDLEGGIPLDADPTDEKWAAPLAPTVDVEDLDALLSKHKVSHDERAYTLRLGTRAIADLLAGREAIVEATPARKSARATPTLLRLTPKRQGQQPASLEMVIDDLPAFLARPQVPSIDGTGLAVKLSADEVTALRQIGQTEVAVGDSSVTLTVSSCVEPAAAPQAVSYAQIVASSGVSETAARPVRPPLSEIEGFEPPATEPPRFDVVLNLQWLQKWELLGYSRGQLLNTVSLAPQEESTVEIFTWDRRQRSEERSSSVDTEESLERSDTVRDTTDVMRQAQSNSEFGFNASGTIGITYEQILNVSATAGASQKQAFGGLAKTTTNFVHEAVVKSANRVKLSRQTKVSESREEGREERVSRKVRNPNMCHTLNLDYFEVLANYSIKTTFSRDESGACVLVKNPIALRFDRWALRVYEETLSRVLLDRQLAPGFAAARLLEARDQACDVLCAECRCREYTGERSAEAVSALQGLMQSIGQVVWELTNTFSYIYQWLDILQSLDDESLRNPVYLTRAQWWVFSELIRLSQSSLYRLLVQISKAWKANEAISERLIDQLRFELDSEGGVLSLRGAKMYAEYQDEILLSIIIVYGRLLSDHPDYVSLNTWDKPANPFPNMVKYSGLFDSFDDNGLLYYLSQFVTLHDAAKKSRQDAAGAAAQQLQEDISRGDAILGAFGLREVTEALEREEALLEHLNMNGSYYRAMLWNALPPTEKQQFLSALLPSGIVDPHLVGFLGGKLAFPLRLDASPEAQALIDQLIIQNTAVAGLERVETVTMPTPAVTLEARLGACDACEDFIQKQRDLDVKLKDAEVDQARQRAEQEKHEAERYKQRLAASDLEDPAPGRHSNAIHVVVTQEKDDD